MRLLYSLYRLWKTKAPINKVKAFYAYFQKDAEEKLLWGDIFLENCYFTDLSDEPIIHDLGANIGYATLYFKNIRPKARITCFEPSPANLPRLIENLENKQDILVHPIALGNRNGEVEFYLRDGGIVDGIFSYKDKFETGRKIMVPISKYSSFLEGFVDFLKIDVEGAEKEILIDLDESGKFYLIQSGIIEWHHNYNNDLKDLGTTLDILKRNGFDYEIQSNNFRDFERDKAQNILIYFYRGENGNRTD